MTFALNELLGRDYCTCRPRGNFISEKAKIIAYVFLPPPAQPPALATSDLFEGSPILGWPPAAAAEGPFWEEQHRDVYGLSRRRICADFFYVPSEITGAVSRNMEWIRPAFQNIQRVCRKTRLTSTAACVSARLLLPPHVAWCQHQTDRSSRTV